MHNLAHHLDHFRARVLQDALSEATAAYWERRARAFTEAAPRAGDFMGRATRAELDDRRRRCLDTAEACLAHARLLRGLQPEPVSAEVRAALSEVA